MPWALPSATPTKLVYCLAAPLDWDYDGGEVHLSMPGYIDEALVELDHPHPKKKQHSPFPYTAPKYGEKVQYAKDEDKSPKLDKEGQKFIQRAVGKFSFIARAIDSTMLTALNGIAVDQAAPTEETMRRMKQFLDYAASQEEPVLTFRASDMILAGHSDAGYLNERRARSRVGGHWFCSENTNIPRDNGAILNIAQVIKAVMSSAAEAELGRLYINAREAVYLRKILEAMGHPQPRTPLQTDNSTAEGVINKNVQPKCTKAMDMRFHWLRDRKAQQQFRIYWLHGTNNKANYWSKTQHPTAHHRAMRCEILTPLKKLIEFRKRQKERKQ